MVIFLLMVIVVPTDTADPMFSVDPPCFIVGQTLVLTCKTDDLLQPIEFQKDNLGQGSCPSPFPCSTSVTGYQTPQQNGVFTTMEITEYNATRDDGVWICTYSNTLSKTYQLQESPCGSGTDSNSCDEPLIYVLFFIPTLLCVTTIFFLVIWFNLRFPNIGKIVLIIIGVVFDMTIEIILLWGIEYGIDFKLFESDTNCRVVRIGVVCHVVAAVIEIVKVVVQYRYIEKLGANIFGRCLSHGEIEEVRNSNDEERRTHITLLPVNGNGREGTSAGNRSETVTKPEDIMLFMHFTVPSGYTVNKWVTEENASIEDNPKYVSNDRGTLLIKSATEKDNGIYQGILKSGGNEQRVNAVLHVTGQRSANLIINPLIWRQVKTKQLKKINDLKEIRHKVSRNEIDSIPMRNEEESNVRIQSIRWKHNGKMTPNLSNFQDGDDSVPPFTVTKNQPIDEYHCTVEFTNNKSQIYIFIVKFTGVRSGNTLQSAAMHTNKVGTVDDVVGVPTFLNTRREETIPSLPPLS